MEIFVVVLAWYVADSLAATTLSLSAASRYR